jgi:hypothetical protein
MQRLLHFELQKAASGSKNRSTGRHNIAWK